jgi:hypothetical protein
VGRLTAVVDMLSLSRLPPGYATNRNDYRNGSGCIFMQLSYSLPISSSNPFKLHLPERLRIRSFVMLIVGLFECISEIWAAYHLGDGFDRSLPLLSNSKPFSTSSTTYRTDAKSFATLAITLTEWTGANFTQHFLYHSGFVQPVPMFRAQENQKKIAGVDFATDSVIW